MKLELDQHLTSTDRVTQIERGIDAMTRNNPSIMGIVSCGSFARGGFDQFSDIDLYIFTTSVKDFIDPDNSEWKATLGNAISMRIFKDGGKTDKVKLIIDDGLMYDLTIVSVKKFKLLKRFIKLREMGLGKIIPPFIARAFNDNINVFYSTIKRGYKVHGDRMGLAEMIEAANHFVVKYNRFNGIFSVNEKEFYEQYNVFWQLCYVASVKLIRGDFYLVMLTFDVFMKAELLRMIEWDAKLNDSTVDCYYHGYQIRKWGGEKLNEELLGTLLRDNLHQMQNCILYMIELYQRHSKTVIEKSGFKPNRELENFVVNFIKNIALNVPEKRN